MKNINDVHGRFNSFKALAAALDMKQPKAKSEKARKCPVCGGKLRNIGAGNVWICDFSTLEEAEYEKNGKTVKAYVIKKCPYQEINPV